MNMVNLNNKNGITLVALVVTIIILLILAGVSFNLLIGNNGIITKAQEARRMQEIAETIIPIQLEIVAKEAEVLKTRNGILQVEIEEILEKFGTVNKNEDGTIKSLTPMDKEYEIEFKQIYAKEIVPYEPETIGEAKISYVTKKTPVRDNLDNTVIIPNGFKVSKESGANINEGIVIEDKKGNEFVWIPVALGEEETFESKYKRTYFKDNEATGNIDSSYAEPYLDGYDEEDDEYDAMVASVNLNKGFYIGRYETGFIGETGKGTYTSFAIKPTQEQIEEETSKLVVQKDSQIYNFVPWGSTMDDITAANKGTEENPAYVIGAVELAQNFDNVNNYSGVTSTLMYGINRDMVMRYVSDEKNVNDSASWGNYRNYADETGDTQTASGSLQTAGKNVNWQAKKNI